MARFTWSISATEVFSGLRGGVSKSAPVAQEPVILEREPLADVPLACSRRRHPLRDPCQMRTLGQSIP